MIILLEPSDKTSRLKEDFMRKLPKLKNVFYDDFNKLFKSGRWVQFPQVEKDQIWEKYMRIINTQVRVH